VAIEARKAEQSVQTLLDDHDLAELSGDNHDDSARTGDGPGTNVIPLPRRTPIPDDSSPLPSVAIYDQLLKLRTAKGSA